MRTADANNSTVILANDPDADRLALAEKQPESVISLFIIVYLAFLICREIKDVGKTQQLL